MCLRSGCAWSGGTDGSAHWALNAESSASWQAPQCSLAPAAVALCPASGCADATTVRPDDNAATAAATVTAVVIFFTLNLLRSGWGRTPIRPYSVGSARLVIDRRAVEPPTSNGL